MEAVIIHSSIIMIIWNCLIFIVLSGTGTENLSFYMSSPDKLHAEIGEKQIILSEGEAIFINSKILHRFYASSGGIIPNFRMYAGIYCAGEQPDL